MSDTLSLSQKRPSFSGNKYGAGICDTRASLPCWRTILVSDGLSEMLRVDRDIVGRLWSFARLLDAQQRCPLAGVGDVRAGETGGFRCEFGSEMIAVDTFGQLQPLHVVEEDGLAALLAGRPHPDDLVEAARAAQGDLDVFRPIRRGKHENFSTIFQPIQQSEELGHHGLLVMGVCRGPRYPETVDLVEKDDGGGMLPGPLEDAPERGLGLAHPLRQQGRPGHNLDVGIAFASNRPSQQALSRTRWPGQDRTMCLGTGPDAGC